MCWVLRGFHPPGFKAAVSQKKLLENVEVAPDRVLYMVDRLGQDTSNDYEPRLGVTARHIARKAATMSCGAGTARGASRGAKEADVSSRRRRRP